MSVACPNGHQSETTDYCDQCGARIPGPTGGATLTAVGHTTVGHTTVGHTTVGHTTLGPSAVPTPGGSGGVGGSSPPAGASAAGSPAGGAPTASGGAGHPGEELCPVCQAPRVGEDRFCEGCGYDFTAPPSTASAGTVLAAVPGTTSAPAWEAIAVADRDYYDRVAPEGVNFPLHCPPRTFLLAGDQIRIGRRSDSRGIQPEVDLAGAPEDSAISHLHCILLEQSDGSYAVVDPGSTNGTTLNEDATPLVANSAVALADGDRVHIGAWTTITVRARPAGATTTP
jgi:hypothetical protein